MANGTFGGNRPAKPQRTPLQALLYWTIVLGVWGLIFVVAFFAVFASDLPDTSKLYDVKRQPSINYLDRSGALLAVRGSQYAPPVDLDALPEYVPAAFVAIEDRQFYHHIGFNPWGIARSLIEIDPEQRAALKKAGLLTRDSRRKESKKYGLKRARKAPQYTKR